MVEWEYVEIINYYSADQLNKLRKQGLELVICTPKRIVPDDRLGGFRVADYMYIFRRRHSQEDTKQQTTSGVIGY